MVVENIEVRSRPGPNLKVPPQHLPGGTEENPWRNLSQDGRRCGSNPRSSECEVNALPLLRRYVSTKKKTKIEILKYTSADDKERLSLDTALGTNPSVSLSFGIIWTLLGDVT